MDSILLLILSHLTVIPAEKRHYNEEFTDLFLFFKVYLSYRSQKFPISIILSSQFFSMRELKIIIAH